MPKGQDRYANRARKRTPRSGQTIRIGKTVGVAPLVGEYDDVRRWLKDLVTDGLMSTPSTNSAAALKTVV